MPLTNWTSGAFHSDLICNLSPSLASNRKFALARRIDKLNRLLPGKTDIDEVTRIVDLELERLSRQRCPERQREMQSQHAVHRLEPIVGRRFKLLLDAVHGCVGEIV